MEQLIVRPRAGANGGEEKAEKLTAPTFLGSLLPPSDRAAILTLDRATGQAEQRIVTVEQAASPAFQRWLRYKNCHGSDIYVAPNPIRDGSRSRTTQDIACIRHCWIDLDADGDAALEVLQSSPLVPRPNIVVNTSRGKFQCIWRVEGLSIAEGAAVNRALAATFGGDAASCDVAHVLRWAGFTNRKYSPPYWVTAQKCSDAVYQLADFRLQLEVAKPAPQPRKVAGSSFISTEPAPSPWESKRPPASLDEVLATAGYTRDGRNYTCPTCGHGSASVDRKDALLYCHACKRGLHLGSIARKQGRRLAL